MESPSANQDFASHIVRQWTAEKQNGASSFLGGAEPAQRARVLYRIQNCWLHTQANLVAVHFHLRASTGQRLYQPCADKTKPDRIHVDVVTTPDRKSTRLNSSHLGISYA